MFRGNPNLVKSNTLTLNLILDWRSVHWILISLLPKIKRLKIFQELLLNLIQSKRCLIILPLGLKP